MKEAALLTLQAQHHIPLASSLLSQDLLTGQEVPKIFLGVKLANPAFFINSAIFIYVFVRFVPKWEEGNSRYLEQREFNATLQVSCQLQFGQAVDVQQPNASPLRSFLWHKYRLSPSLPPSSSLASVFFQHYVTNAAQTPVMQYDLLSYQLLAWSTISSS